MKKAKKRLFVDMDGVLAVFKTVSNMETLYEKGFFSNLSAQENVLQAVRNLLIHEDEIEVYVLSAIPKESAYAYPEKNAWLNRYLPELSEDHRIFVPCNENKAEFVPNGIKRTDFLLDDRTQNLILWQPPGIGIKLLNGINHTRESWGGNRIRADRLPEDITGDLKEIILKGKEVRDIRPAGEDMERMITSMERTLKDISAANRNLIRQNAMLSDAVKGGCHGD